MRVITPGKINIEHIMWEPQGSCSMKCHGCYAAYSPARDYQDEPIPLIEDSNISAEQLTFALNTKPGPNAKAFLAKLISSYPVWRDKYSEICITCNNEQALDEWCEPVSLEILLKTIPVKMISLSTLPSQEFSDLCRKNRVLLNWNVVVDGYQRIALAEGRIDSMYLILKKSPLGDQQDLGNLSEWITTYLDIKDMFSFKVIPDSCIVESLGFAENGLACSAGIHKVQVWADGGCTGCPYDSKRILHNKESHTVSKRLVEELQWSTSYRLLNNSPIEFCSIWSALDSLDIEDDPHRINELKRTLAYRSTI